MLVVSDNLNVVHRHVAEAVAQRDAASVKELAHKITEAGADIIDVNLGPATPDAAEAMPWLVEQIQQVSDLQLSLDSGSPQAIMAGAEKARKKPIINGYFVASARPGELLSTLVPYAGQNGLELILPTLEPSGPPLDPDERAARGVELVNAALEAGLSQDQIYLDPVVIHLAGPSAQDHSRAVLETMKRLPRLYDPPIRTIAGVQYLSQGAPLQLRSAINRPLLAMMGALGLTAAMVNVTDRETMRDVRLIKALLNESLYSVSDAELK
jgi:5-methyltetrahydrofolate corrinoid/iron sulfur protein methyltransferase